MAEAKKFYWLKLKRDFFKRHDIRIIEEMPNGKDYILFYLKLLLESIDHEGSLRFSDTIPYNEQMLSVVTHTNIDIVRSAMKLFIELGMMSIFDDQTIYMTEVNKLIGCETEWAKKKRLYREKMDEERTLSSPCPPDVPSVSDKSKSKSIEIDKEIDIEVDVVTPATTTEPVENSESDKLKCIQGSLGKGVVYLTDTQFANLIDKLGLDGFNRYVERLADFIIQKKAYVKSHYDTILKWYAEDSKT